RSCSAAVNIPDYGVLVIGGLGKNRLILRSTELLTRRSGVVGGGGGEKWQWLPYIPMNKEHGVDPLAVYFQGRVYVVGRGEKVNEMEMLDMAASGQWTSLTSFGPGQYFSIYHMAIVGNDLFVNVNDMLYSIELDGDLKRQLTKWRKRKSAFYGDFMTVH
ncbi:unnamed protein product, partial [Hymenolepis diminuta]